MRGPSDDQAVAEGCYFDLDAGSRVVEFLETFCRQSKGEWGGQALVLLDWQKDFILRLYGWKRPDGTRRFRKGYLEVAKKNGKSTLVSGLSLYHLIGDGENAPEIYLNACDREQARIVFDEAKRMLEASDDLKEVLEAIDSKSRIVCRSNNGTIKAQSKETASKDGLNSSFVVFDELHRQPNSDMFRVYRYSGVSRRQPLILSITTAGHDRTSVCWGEREYSLKVNSGEIRDISHLGVIYGAEATDDIQSPDTWRKANPSMGFTLKEADFAEALAEAEGKPTELNEFLRLRLNIWTNAAERFLRRDKWDACGKEAVDPAELIGRPCYGGLDLSTTQDMTAFVAIFPRDSGGYDVRCLFWLPEANIGELAKKSNAPYLHWSEKGFLTLTPGNVVDYDRVRADIRAFSESHDLRKLFADRWNATQLCGQLVADGLPVEYLGQGFSDQTAPTKELERLVLAADLRHGDNPILNWHVDNAMAVRGENESVKLSKSKSTGKIDGAAALVNSIAAAISDGDGPSVYNQRGMLYL